MPDQWLVRTAKNVIAGPYPREHVRRLIQEGQLGAQDEVCAANDYWFFLHETDEVRDKLGIELIFHEAGDEEETKTQTDPSLEATQGAGGTATMIESADTEGPVPELTESPDQVQADARVMSNRELRSFKKKAAPKKEKAAFTARAVVSGKVEKSSIWRGLALILGVLVIVLFFFVLHLINSD